MENKAHKTLKQFFTVTTAAFTMMNSVSAAFGRMPHPTAMETLHRMALQELEKPEPNAEFLDGLLFKMEQLAEEYKNSQTNHQQPNKHP
jgi:hypothetical protein